MAKYGLLEKNLGDIGTVVQAIPVSEVKNGVKMGNCAVSPHTNSYYLSTPQLKRIVHGVNHNDVLVRMVINDNNELLEIWSNRVFRRQFAPTAFKNIYYSRNAIVDITGKEGALSVKKLGIII